MLYYLKQELVGAEESKLFDNTNWSHIDIPPVPKCEGEPPTSWYVHYILSYKSMLQLNCVVVTPS